jgi:hypothetical protein
MPTGWSQEQLNYLTREMEDNVPPIPTRALKKGAPRVTAMRAAGTELGMIFNFGLKDGKSIQVAFNCVVAKEFAGAINETGQILGWQKKGLLPAPADHLPFPKPGELPLAVRVASLATDSTADGILASFYAPEFAAGNGTFTLFFPVRAALEMLISITNAAEAARWWTADYELLARVRLN